MHDDVHLVVKGANRRAAREGPGFNILWQCLISNVTANMCFSHSWSTSHFKLLFSLIALIESYGCYAVLSNIEENKQEAVWSVLKQFWFFSPPLCRFGRVFKHTRSLQCRWMLQHCRQLFLQVSPGILHLCGWFKVYRWVLCHNGCQISLTGQSSWLFFL